jgi:hypothetical protein
LLINSGLLFGSNIQFMKSCMNVFHHRKKIVGETDPNVWTLIKLTDCFFEQLLVVVINKNGFIVKFIGWCQELMLSAVIKLFQVFTYALFLLAFFEVQI